MESIRTATLVVAAVGVFTLMLKNPDDMVFNIPILLCIMVAIALANIKPQIQDEAGFTINDQVVMTFLVEHGFSQFGMNKV